MPPSLKLTCNSQIIIIFFSYVDQGWVGVLGRSESWGGLNFKGYIKSHQFSRKLHITYLMHSQAHFALFQKPLSSPSDLPRRRNFSCAVNIPCYTGSCWFNESSLINRKSCQYLLLLHLAFTQVVSWDLYREPEHCWTETFFYWTGHKLLCLLHYTRKNGCQIDQILPAKTRIEMRDRSWHVNCHNKKTKTGVISKSSTFWSRQMITFHWGKANRWRVTVET